MQLESDIKTRTFGIEIEMCNFDRDKVTLPSGYSWSKDESIDNTDCSSNRKFGGEVNTPPLSLCSQKDLHELKSVYESIVNAGGVLKWSIDTHVHIYVGDLDVEKLKSVFLFFYVCYPYFKKYAHISDWDEMTFNCQPLPVEKYYYGVLNAQTFEQIRDLFTNQSKKGFIRHAVNISAYFKTKTIEFRMFHATDDFYTAMNCVYSAYRIFYYAVNHTLEDFKAISSYEEFLSVTKLKYSTPPELVPLLYQGNPYSPIETFMTRPIQYNSTQASVIHEALKKHDRKEIAIVNGFMFYYELYFFEKIDVKIYSQDPFCHLLYLLANGRTAITYRGKLEWLEEYNENTPQRQIALALYASKLQKYFMSESHRNSALFASLRMRAKESIEKTEKASERLIRMLTTCEYHWGNLQDAVNNEKTIFFNYGTDKIQKRTYKLIRENSNIELDVQPKRHEFYQFVETLPEDTYFYYISNSPFLNNMHKLNMIYSSSGSRWSAGRYLYSNKEAKDTSVNQSYGHNKVETKEIVPPDDLVIDNPDLLKIVRVSAETLYCLQKKYVKKVENVSMCKWTFIVMYDKYTLGGFGMTLSHFKGYDLFQLSDFCTNNNIPRLAKLILYCIQTKQVQKELSRIMHMLVEKVISLAYTQKPVSMKYRGVYKKIKEQCTNSHLGYEGQLGIYENTKAVIEKYKKQIKDGNRG